MCERCIQLESELERLRAALGVLRGRLLNAGARCEGLKIEPGMGALINDMIDRIEALGIDGPSAEPGASQPSAFEQSSPRAYVEGLSEKSVSAPVDWAPKCQTTGCGNYVESSEDYCTDCLDRRSARTNV